MYRLLFSLSIFARVSDRISLNVCGSDPGCLYIDPIITLESVFVSFLSNSTHNMLTQELFNTYGRPKKIAADMDQQFCNKLFEHVFNTMKVKLNFVNPYNHNALKVE